MQFSLTRRIARSGVKKWCGPVTWCGRGRGRDEPKNARAQVKRHTTVDGKLRKEDCEKGHRVYRGKLPG